MDKNRVLKAIDYAIAGLNELKAAITEAPITVSEQFLESLESPAPQNVQVNSEALAKCLACTYTTKHPEYDVDSQLGNLKDMIQTDKISYVINWLRRGDIKGIEDFFNLSVDAKRREMLIAIDTFGEKIKSVFTQRFGKK